MRRIRIPIPSRGGDGGVSARLDALRQVVSNTAADPEPEPAGMMPAASDEETINLAQDLPQDRRSAARESPFAIALATASIAIVLLGGLAYFSAREFSHRAADDRASEEARSIGEHGSTLATGDAFGGYLQILRYADDNALRAKIATRAQRESILQQDIYLNTNKMYALAVADRSGFVLASVGMEMTSVRDSEAFTRTRASLGPANSDITIPPDGTPGYVEFAAPLRDPVDGTVWAILYGRASPDVLWRTTIGASIDGSRNVIINQKGEFAAGVPQEFVGQPWRGATLGNGAIRANIGGVDSICGLGAVGQNTQIDRGWAVAACVPASLIQIEARGAMGHLGLVIIAGCVLAIAIAAAILRVALPSEPGPALVVASTQEPGALVHAPTSEFLESTDLQDAVEGQPAGAEPAPLEERRLAEVDAPEPSSAEPVRITQVTPDVDAARLISAFEERSARLAEEIRQRLQASLMIVASQATEAFRIAAMPPVSSSDDDGEAESQRAGALDNARRLHAVAMRELEDLRERDLRAVAQQLHPAIVSLGLPAALRTLETDARAGLAITVEVEPDTDSRDGTANRPIVADAQRLIVFRAGQDLIRSLIGADSLALRLERDDHDLLLTATWTGAAIRSDALDATRSAAEAFGGRIIVDSSASRLELRLPAPSIGAPVGDEDPRDVDQELAESPTVMVEAPSIDPRAPAAAFRASIAAAARTRDQAARVEVDDQLALNPLFTDELAGVLAAVALAVIDVASPSEDARSAVWLRQLRETAFMTVTTATREDRAPLGDEFGAARDALEARGAIVTVTDHDGTRDVEVEVALTTQADPAEVKVIQLRSAQSNEEQPAA